MKKKIFDALKAKFEGVSDSILDRYADKLAKTVTTEEQVATAVAGVTIQSLIESYADSRATEATNTAVANYEKKHGIKDGKPVEQQKEDDKNSKTQAGGEEVPSWAKALIESNKALADKVDAMQSEKTTADRRKQLSDITAGLPAAVQKAYNRISVESLTEEQFEALKQEVAAEAEDISKETNAKGAVFGKPTVQGGSKTQTTGDNAKEASEDETKAVLDKLGI